MIGKGISDYSYVSLFDKCDVPTLQKMINKINRSVVYAMQTGGEHNTTLSDHYLEVCEKRWNDHSSVLLEIGNKKVDLQQVVKSDPKDMVTTAGLRNLIDLILVLGSGRYVYIGKGTGQTSASKSDTTLASEVSPRQSVLSTITGLNGWTEWAGLSMRFAALFGETHPTMAINESGVFTTSTSGTMLARDLYYPSAPMTHTQNVSAFLICLIVEFIPKNVLAYGGA